MGVDSANAQPGALPGPRRSAWLTVALAGVVILAAGLAGQTHFGGLRLTPHVHAHAPAKKPATITPPQQAAKPGNVSQGSSSLTAYVIIILLVIVAVLVGYVLLRLWLARRAPMSSGFTTAGSAPKVEAPEPPPEPEVLMTGIAAALQALDEERDPADAIVRAWLGMEETARESGIRRGQSETPTEFTTRIMRVVFADDRAIQTLLRLYLRTRFGDHPPSSEDVVAVRAALAQLVSDWQNSPGGRLARSRER